MVILACEILQILKVLKTLTFTNYTLPKEQEYGRNTEQLMGGSF